MPNNPNTWNPLCSSKFWKNTMPEKGIFNPQNNAKLKNANKVFIRYCTGDAHMGNNASFGWEFRGQDFVTSVLNDLVQTKGFGKGPGKDTLYFGGGSAGGRGAMIHLDYVYEMLNNNDIHINNGNMNFNNDKIDIIGFLDSPLWIDIPPFSTSKFIGFNETTAGIYSYGNVTHLDEDCVNKYSVTEGWKCMFGEYRMPFIKTPYFLVASQYDEFQLLENIGHKPNTNAELEYAEMFHHKTLNVVTNLKHRKNNSGIFSWACYNHCVSINDNGYNTDTCNGITMNDAFSTFLNNYNDVPLNENDFWFDSCEGFNCGKGCNP